MERDVDGWRCCVPGLAPPADGRENMNSENRTDEQARFTWREVERVDAPKRSATDRVADFLEVYSNLDEESARQQAARCIQCPNPACVTGCPMANRIPEWLALTAEGHLLEAAELVLMGSSMPEIFSRICAQERQCEAQLRGGWPGGTGGDRGSRKVLAGICVAGRECTQRRRIRPTG
jgi:hypothetical protein